MSSLHLSRNAIGLVETVAAGGLATAVTLIAAITAATLIYAWFIV